MGTFLLGQGAPWVGTVFGLRPGSILFFEEDDD